MSKVDTAFVASVRLLRIAAIGRRPGWTLVRIAVLVLTAFLLFKYVLMLRRIESVSMVPAFRDGSIHLVNRLAYFGGRAPQRGDVVAVRTSGETVLYVKRVVGLPLETIAIRDGTVFIDGCALAEDYVRLPRRSWNRSPVKLGADQYYIIGDNRSMSQHQHEFGAVEGRRIVGKVIW